MKVNVGLIGSHFINRRLLDVANEFPRLNVLDYPFENEAQTVSILLENKSHLDIVVFSGPVTYQLAKREVERLGIPHFYKLYDETSVMSIFIYLMHHQQQRLNRLSVDITDTDYVQRVLNDLSISRDQIYMVDYDQLFKAEEVVDFHLNLWKSHKTEYALTCRLNVYNELIKQGVPCIRMVPTNQTVRAMMHQVDLKAEALLASKAKPAVMNIGLNIQSDQWLSNVTDEKAIKLYHLSLKGLVMFRFIRIGVS